MQVRRESVAFLPWAEVIAGILPARVDMNVSLTLSSLRRARGFIDLAFDVVDETSHLVERTHDAVVMRSSRRFARSKPARGVGRVVTTVQLAISSSVFRSIRAINGMTRLAVNATADVATEGLSSASDLGDVASVKGPGSIAGGRPGRCVDALESTLNGFWGDYLSRNGLRLDRRDPQALFFGSPMMEVVGRRS